jgi:hypothetical protein
MQYKTLKDAYDALNECALVLREENESLNICICDFEQNYVLAEKFNDDHEDALHEFIRCSFNRSKIASMIYNVSRNNGEGIGYSHFKNWDKPQQSSWEGEIPPKLYSTFVKNGIEILNVSDTEKTSEPQRKGSEVVSSSEPKTSEPTGLITSETQVKAQKMSKPLKSQRINTFNAGLKSEVLIYSKYKSKNQFRAKQFYQSSIDSRSSVTHKRQKKNKVQRTNFKGPIRI